MVEKNSGSTFWHYEHWYVFRMHAHNYSCKLHISKGEVNKADELLVKFCAEFEQLYGKEAVTPNLHMHVHLKDCIQDKNQFIQFGAFHLSSTMVCLVQ